VNKYNNDNEINDNVCIINDNINDNDNDNDNNIVWNIININD